MPTRTARLPRRLVPAALVVALAVGALAWSGAARAHAAEPAPEPDEALSKAMHQMEDALKALGGGVKAETRADALEQLSRLESAIVAAKACTPPSAAQVEEKKRAAFEADFRKQLVAALRLAADAEVAICDGKYKDADAIVRNKLSALKSAGHSKFRPEGGR